MKRTKEKQTCARSRSCLMEMHASFAKFCTTDRTPKVRKNSCPSAHQWWATTHACLIRTFEFIWHPDQNLFDDSNHSFYKKKYIILCLRYFQFTSFMKWSLISELLNNYSAMEDSKAVTYFYYTRSTYFWNMLSCFIHKIFCVVSFSKLQLEFYFVLHHVAKIKELDISMTRRQFYRNVLHISSIVSSSIFGKRKCVISFWRPLFLV